MSGALVIAFLSDSCLFVTKKKCLNTSLKCKNTNFLHGADLLVCSHFKRHFSRSIIAPLPSFSLHPTDIMWDKERRWNPEQTFRLSPNTPLRWFTKEYIITIKKNSSSKGRPSQILIKGWLKTIKDINCNFHAISESWEHGSGSLLFPNPVISSKDCLSSWGEKDKKRRRRKKNTHFSPREATPTSNLRGVIAVRG